MQDDKCKPYSHDNCGNVNINTHKNSEQGRVANLQHYIVECDLQYMKIVVLLH